MSRRLFDPRSVQQNERPIVRKQYRFDDGMRMSPDCEGLDVGDGTSNNKAVAYLNNCRGFKAHIEGDPGTVRFTAAKFSVLITDNSEELSDALLTGELFVANGNAELADETVFEVRGFGDFEDDDLFNAKNGDPRPHDHFRYNATTGYLEYVGNCRVPALTGFGDTTGNEIRASKTGTTIIRSGGPEFTPDLVGCFFVWDYNLQDRITEYVDSNTLKCTLSEASKTSVYCRIEPDVFASYMHRSRQVWVILAGNKLYISNGIPARGWTEIPVCADFAPDAKMSLFREDGDDLVLMNPAGWYRVILNNVPWAYRLNENAPSTRIGDIESVLTAYTYRIIYTMSLISGFDVLTKNRLSTDVVQGHESAPAANFEVIDRDYGITMSVNSADTNGYIKANGVRYPASSRHFTHYSLYCTLNVNQAGVDEGNKSNQFVYAADIPAAKGLTVSIASGEMEVFDGVLSAVDEGDVIRLSGIGTYLLTGVRYTGGHWRAGLSQEGMTNPEGPDPGTVSQAICYAGIGEGAILRVSISNNFCSLISGGSFSPGDVGKFLFASTDAYLIKRVINDATVELAWSSDAADVCVVMNPTVRYPRIVITDAILKSRRDAASAEAAEYYLQSRYYKPLPNCSAWAIESGWMIGAMSGDHVYYYSDMARSKHLGYYKESKQYNNKIPAAITQIVGYSGAIYVRCRNSTHKIPTSVPVEVGDRDSGEQCSMLPDPIEVDGVIGVITQFDSVRFPRGGEVVLTSEPAMRFFDGTSYGEPYDVDRVNKAMIRKCRRPVIMSYAPHRGLIIWGRRDNAS